MTGNDSRLCYTVPLSEHSYGPRFSQHSFCHFLEPSFLWSRAHRIRLLANQTMHFLKYNNRPLSVNLCDQPIKEIFESYKPSDSYSYQMTACIS